MHIMKKISIVCICMFLLAGCSKDNIPNNNQEPISITLTKAEENIAQSEINFSLRLLQALEKDEDVYKTDPNIFVSPYSVNAVLSILANGVTDNTAEKIYNLLGYDKNDTESANTYYSLMNKSLMTTDPHSSLSLANSMWYNTAYTNGNINPNFESAGKKYYNLLINGDNFKQNGNSVKDNINTWSSKNTDGQIGKVIDRVDPNTVVYFLNSVLFKSPWKNGVSFKDTNSMFYSYNGTQKNIKMIKAKTRSVAVIDIYDMSCVKIPFGNGSFSFIAMMPKDGMTFETALDAMQKEVTFTDLNRFFNDALNEDKYNPFYTESEVMMPNINIESKIDMVNTINKMGDNSLFDNIELNIFNKTLRGMNVNFCQRSKIELNKDGVRATAVSTGEVGVTDPNPFPEVKGKIVLDHPYMFFISENSTNTILFAGVVRILN